MSILSPVPHRQAEPPWIDRLQAYPFLPMPNGLMNFIHLFSFCSITELLLLNTVYCHIENGYARLLATPTVKSRLISGKESAARFGRVRRNIQSVGFFRTSNSEHRTPNVECGGRFAPSFTKKHFQSFLPSVKQCFQIFKNDSMPYSKFEVGRSMFDDRRSLSGFQPPSGDSIKPPTWRGGR